MHTHTHSHTHIYILEDSYLIFDLIVELAALSFQHWQEANHQLSPTASLGPLVNENYQQVCNYGQELKNLGSTVLAQFKNHFSVPND